MLLLLCPFLTHLQLGQDDAGCCNNKRNNKPSNKRNDKRDNTRNTTRRIGISLNGQDTVDFSFVPFMLRSGAVAATLSHIMRHIVLYCTSSR